MYTPDSEKEKPGLPGIEFEETTTRVYTPGKFASSLLGYANYDNDSQRILGQMGLEAFFDEELTGKNGKVISKKDGNGYSIPGTEKTVELSKNGKDVYLTIDKDIQSTLESSLQKSIEVSKAEKAWGIVIEVETGKILAYAGNPTYDLNERDQIIWTDFPSMFMFEPGSVMKPFTYAAAMEEGVYDPNRMVETGRFCIAYNDAGEIYRAGGLGDCDMYGNINDARREGWGTISLDQGLIYSSNTCIATILTDYLNSNVYMDYLEKLGFFKATGMEGVELSEESGIENRGHPIERIMAGFGQGQSITTLQLVQAYTAILNEGHMVKPYVVDRIVDPTTNEVEQRTTTYVNTDEQGNSIPVFSKSTTDQIVDLLARVLQTPGGASHAYNIDGLNMVGKTGTGEIAGENGYRSDLFTSSIIAAAPADDPKIMVFYALQGPGLNNDTSFFKDVFKLAYEKMNLGNEQTSTGNNDTSYDNWQEYDMPVLKNHSIDYAKNKLETMKVHPVIIGDGTSVLEQSPSSSQKISTNQNVFIVTNGTNISLPNMVGWSYRDVLTFKDLTKLNLVINGQGVVTSQSVEPNKIVASDTEIVLQLE